MPVRLINGSDYLPSTEGAYKVYTRMTRAGKCPTMAPNFRYSLLVQRKSQLIALIIHFGLPVQFHFTSSFRKRQDLHQYMLCRRIACIHPT